MSDQDHLFRFFNEIAIVAQLSQTLFGRVVPEGMTLAQFSVLNHFVRLGRDRTPGELASAFQVSRPTMTSTLGRLSAKGLVAIAPHPTDHRAKVVSLTPAGRAMWQDCLSRLAPELTRVASVLADVPVTELIPVLTTVRERLDADRDA